MTSRANQRSVRSILRSAHKPKKLNILTFATHERYEHNLCKTGHNFYSLKVLPGKEGIQIMRLCQRTIIS